MQVRRNGGYQTETFEKLSEAQEWQRFMEAKPSARLGRIGGKRLSRRTEDLANCLDHLA